MAVRSLLNLSIEKVASQLWNQPTTFEITYTLYEKQLEPLVDRLWNEMTGLIKSNGCRMIDNIPWELENRLGDILHHIQDRITEWMDEILYFSGSLVEPTEFRIFLCRLIPNFVLTGAYDEDKVSTAKSIVADVQLSVKLRFKIAIQYCLQDEILNMWKNMDTYTRLQCINCPFDTATKELYKFWIPWVQKLMEDDTFSPSREAFDRMFQFINSDRSYYMTNSAKRYFWEKATAVDRETTLEIVLDNLSTSPFMEGIMMPHFLFRQLDTQQLQKLLRDSPLVLLGGIARHQNPDHIDTDLLESCLAKIPEEKFTYALILLTDGLFSTSLIETVWKGSSTACRRSFYTDDRRVNIYKRLQQYGSHRLLRRILRGADDSDHQLFGIPPDSELFRDTLCQTKWAVLKIMFCKVKSEESFDTRVNSEIERSISEARKKSATESELEHLRRNMRDFHHSYRHLSAYEISTHCYVSLDI